MSATSTNGTAANAPKFREGDEVVHITASAVPEGAIGRVLSYYARLDKWEVEYDGYPSDSSGGMRAHYPGLKSDTSWLSREEAIELTRDEVRRRISNGR